jgi:transaldolase / glucose-6-phosphate isomerase
MAHLLGRLSADHFIAITDPGTVLETLAREKGFRRVCSGEPEIGGRFSAFSDFGLVPLAMMGVDVGELLARTRPMIEACGPDAAVMASPGVLLGAALGVLARSGQDKVSLICSPALRDLSLWLEQLLAESTGKSGRGIVPVVGEALEAPGNYGHDRVFVHISLSGDPDPNASAIDALEEAGRPVFRISLPDALSIGQELFRWEIATAVAGSVIGVDPFDQPDVEASKVLTRKLMAEFEAEGAFSLQTPAFGNDLVRIFPTGPEAARLTSAASGSRDLDDWLAAFLQSRADGDYVALLAYACPNSANTAALEALRARLGSNGRWATTLGFGPRYLHSSGQVHKGGPNSGVFLVLTSEDRDDVSVPDRSYTFGVVKAAQARADAEALGNAGRRVLRIEVRGNFAAGIRRLADAVTPRPE